MEWGMSALWHFLKDRFEEARRVRSQVELQLVIWASTGVMSHVCKICTFKKNWLWKTAKNLGQISIQLLWFLGYIGNGLHDFTNYYSKQWLKNQWNVCVFKQIFFFCKKLQNYFCYLVLILNIWILKMFDIFITNIIWLYVSYFVKGQIENV